MQYIIDDDKRWGFLDIWFEPNKALQQKQERQKRNFIEFKRIRKWIKKVESKE